MNKLKLLLSLALIPLTTHAQSSDRARPTQNQNPAIAEGASGGLQAGGSTSGGGFGGGGGSAFGGGFGAGPADAYGNAGTGYEAIGSLAGFLARPFQSDSQGTTFILFQEKPDPEIRAEMEEDMAIMARILEKTLPRNDEKHRATAMGIAVSNLGEDFGSIRNLRLPGYGALFFLQVNLPLLPEADQAERPAPNETSSEWETARRELFHPTSSPNPFDLLQSAGLVRKAPRYSEAAVSELKENLLQALRQASNLRHMTQEESVVIIVTSVAPEPRITSRVRLKQGRDSSARTDYRSTSVVPANSRRSVGSAQSPSLTLRAGKKDIDDLAQGKLTAEEFAEKVVILIQ